mgnify:FL=1
MQPLVFSIRPVHVASFRSGVKRFEYRLRLPSVQSGDLALIYETAPVSAVVATVRVGIVYDGDPADVWGATCSLGGITRAEFYSYIGDRTRAVAIEMEPTWLDAPVRLPVGMVAPQSWARWKGTWPA